MGQPRFSIVIPTRERAETLRHALQTCLDQDFDDFEVVVCDNHSSPATRQVVQEANSSRVRYVRADRPLAMSANWELAVSQAAGEYVTVLGDDDGLLPFALRELDRLIRRYGSSVVHWHRGLYTWPTIALQDDANLIRFPLYRKVWELDGRDEIRRVIRFQAGADMLPMIYNAVIHRDLIEEHRQVAGRVFPNLYPDVYTGFSFAYLAGTFLSVGVPMNVAGLSGNSNGIAALFNPNRTAIADEFHRLNDEFGYAPHPLVPDLNLQPIHVVDCFLFAKGFLFPGDDTLTLDRKAITERYLASITATDPATRVQAKRVIRDSLADRPDLQEWFDDEAPDFPPAAPFRFRTARFGYDGYSLTLNALDHGVRDVHAAVKLIASVLGFGAGEIPYDVDPLWEVYAAMDAARAENAAAHEASRRLEDSLHVAQRDGALRFVPRRVTRKVLGLLRGS